MIYNEVTFLLVTWRNTMKRGLFVVLLTFLIASMAISQAQMAPLPPQPAREPLSERELSLGGFSEVMELTLPGSGIPSAPVTFNALARGSRFTESEPNNTLPEANPLPSTDVMVLGNIYPNTDVDYFSFTAAAGSRLYAAVVTSASANSNTDSQLRLLDSAGALIEMDEDDGSFGALSSSIAGANLTAGGTYYLQVNHFSTTQQLRPYTMYMRVQSGAPAAEVEPNNASTTATPLPDSGWVSGAVTPATDTDWYSLALNAGDTVFLSLDMDPERDTVTWNGQLGLGIFGSPAPNMILVANDGNTTSPNSEAFVMTVKNSGTYYAYVAEPTGILGNTYRLSVSVFSPPPAAGACTTYTNATPLPLTDAGAVTSTIIIPDSITIADLNVGLNLTHAYMLDLDVTLTAPGGNQVGLFTDIGSNTQTGMDLTLDDEAAIPSAFTVVAGMQIQPESAYRLSWFDGQNTSGVWTLSITDDTTANTGTLNSWSLTVCQPAPLPVCQKGFAPKVVFSTNFETNNGGFTSSGTQNEWAHGTPTVAPITTCASGTKCWKTDLLGQYNASSSQDLVSPAIDLTHAAGPVMLSWAQKYQMETTSFDHANVSIYEASDGVLAQTLWEWMDGTMTTIIGAVTINESAGWGTFTRDISSYAGKVVAVKYHLDSDSSVHLAGLAVDDFKITACVPSIKLPAIFRAP